MEDVREEMMEALEELEEELREEGFPPPLAIAGSIQAVSMFALPGETDPLAVVGMALHVRPEQDAPLSLIREIKARLDAEMPAVQEEHAGVEVDFRDLEDDEALDWADGRAVLCSFRVDDVFLFALARDRSTSEEFALDAIAALRSREAAGIVANGRFAEARQSALSAPDFEAFLNIETLTRFIPDSRDAEPVVRQLVKSVVAMPWAYASTTIGEDERFESVMSLRYGPDTLFGRVMELARPVDKNMLTLVPADVSALSLASFDVGGLVDLVFELIDDLAPAGTTDQVDARLSAVAGQFGVHPIDDVVRRLDGTMLTFQRARDLSGTGQTERLGQMLETMVFGLENGDDLFDAVDRLLERTGGYSFVEFDDFGEYDVFSLKPSWGIPITWTIDENRLSVAGNRGDLEYVLTAGEEGREGAESVLNGGPLSPTLDQIGGSCLFSVSDTATSLKVLAEVFETMRSLMAFADGMEESRDAFELVIEALGTPGLVDQYFDGVSLTSLEAGAGLVRLRMWGE